MRPQERIKPILKKLDIVKFLSSFKSGGKKIFDQDMIKSCAQNYKKNKKEIEKAWMAAPDLRLTQLLVNNGLIPNLPGLYYYVEETDWLIENKVFKPREILFWGTYGKDGMHFKRILIKDMETDHLKACLETQKGMGLNFRKAMENELKLRSRAKKKKS